MSADITLIFGSSTEKLQFERREGQAKVLGVFIGVSGATLIALYKGPAILIVSSATNGQLPAEMSSFVSWQLGALCLLGNCITWAIWFIIQVLCAVFVLICLSL